MTPPSDPVWRVLGGSVAGTSHLADGRPCQDAHASLLLPGGVLLAAVSDGAGSVSRSDEGARLAVDTVLSELERLSTLPCPASEEDWRGAMRAAFAAAAAALEAEAERAEVPVREFSATLLTAILHPSFTVFASVGDCAAVSRSAAGPWTLAFAPERGEYANETTFLTSPDWPARLQVRLMEESADSLALFSDGLIRLALDLRVPAPHTPFFDSMFAFAATLGDGADESLRAFLDSARVNERTDDDKTLLLAWPDAG